MSSPDYLQLLDLVKNELVNNELATPTIESAWESVLDYYDELAAPDTLIELSIACFAELARTTGLSVSDIMDNAIALHKGKNAGYAGTTPDDPWSNFRAATYFSITAYKGVLVRLSDKIARLRSLAANPANDQVNESKADTLGDAGAYPLIGVCLFAEECQVSVGLIIEEFHKRPMQMQP